MSLKILILISTIVILDVASEEEILAINCKIRKAKFQLNKNVWIDINKTISCPPSEKTILSICKRTYADNSLNHILPIKSSENIKSCTNGSCYKIDINYKLFKCLKIKNIVKPMNVQDDCIFKHTISKCQNESAWKQNALITCGLSSDETEFELYKLMGIFPCIITSTEQKLNFKGIQFVCCPKIKTYEWYMKYVTFTNGTIESELLAFTAAKKSLRKKFKLRQERIQNRYISEEKAINMWSQHPNLAESVENDVKQRFRKSFMIEMNNEVDLLRDLELIHENKMQKLFEKNRRDSKSRLEYTLQETNLEISRVAKALKLELDSILSEANDTIDFLERFYTENLDDDKRNVELIKQNFNNLIKESWQDVIGMLEKKKLMTGDVLKQIARSELKRNMLIKRFNYLNIAYIPKNTMKNQAENHIKNVISSAEHGRSSEGSKKFSLSDSSKDVDSPMPSLFLICLLIVLAILISVVVAFVLCRYPNKIMFHLSNTFKKIHPRTKNVFVQIENYPFKNRYGYGNSVSQAQCKVEESFMGISSGYNYQFNSANKCPENLKNIDQDISENSISNINGLENPICRLLDEK